MLARRVPEIPPVHFGVLHYDKKVCLKGLRRLARAGYGPSTSPHFSYHEIGIGARKHDEAELFGSGLGGRSHAVSGRLPSRLRGDRLLN